MRLIKAILPILIILPLTTWSQCRSFTKKKCLPQLDGYIQNDNFNSAVLIPGDEAELLLTFYANKEYRLLVCGHPVLGELEFEVLDIEESMIYSSMDNEDPDNNIFDFKVASTQQLLVRIRVPEEENPNSLVPMPQGCVSVMIGSKES